MVSVKASSRWFARHTKGSACNQQTLGDKRTCWADIMRSMSGGSGTERGVELQKGSSAMFGMVFSLVVMDGISDGAAAISTVAIL